MGLAAFNRWRRHEGVEGAGREHQGTVDEGEVMESPTADEITNMPSDSVNGEPTMVMEEGAHLVENSGAEEQAAKESAEDDVSTVTVVQDDEDAFIVELNGVRFEPTRNQVRDDGTLTAGGVKEYEAARAGQE